MTINQLIFSDKAGTRMLRHLGFWMFWFVYFGFLHAANPFGSEKISYFRNLPFTLTESLLMLVPQVILTYLLLYFVLPVFAFKRKYLLAIVSGMIIWFACGILTLEMVRSINPSILAAVLPEPYLRNTARPANISFFMAMLANFKGAITIAAIATTIKFSKQWYLKEQRNLQLQKEKTEAQMQLLTAQVHPHFLFNTLNNIYSKTLTESPKGSLMIMGLSDLLRYILYEGNKHSVPLRDELRMLQEYLELEKIRYGNKLELHTRFPHDTGAAKIAPLLLLPFLENSFKHGASNILQQPWISLEIDLEQNVLKMKLMNGKAAERQEQKNASGIGISNVRKRLELLYPEKYTLSIREEDDVFIVDLCLELEMVASDQLPASDLKFAAYA